MIQGLLSAQANLFLWARAVDRSFFDEVSIVQGMIKGLLSSYMLLSPRSRIPTPEFAGNLIFECPVTLLPIVTE